MKILVFCLYIALLIETTLTFSCNDAKSSKSCKGIQGCQWSDNECSGDPTSEENSIYVYPSSNSDDKSDGSISNPYKSLSSAFRALEDDKDITQIIGINLPDQVFHLKEQIEVKSPSLFIKGISTNSYMRIEISDYGDEGAVFVTDGTEFGFRSCNISLQTNKVYNETIFLSSKNSSVSIGDSIVQGDTQNKGSVLLMKGVGSQITYGNVILNGSCVQTQIKGTKRYFSSEFNLNSQLYLSGLRVANISDSCNSIFSFNSSQVLLQDSKFEQIHLDSGEGNLKTFHTIFLGEQSFFRANGSEFNNISSTIFQLQTTIRTDIEYCVFTNLNINYAIRAISTVSNINKTSKYGTPFNFLHNNVHDSSINFNFLLFQSITANVSDCTFKNIEIYYHSYKKIHPDGINGGLIIQAELESLIYVEKSKFKKISFDPIYIRDSVLLLENCLFDNNQYSSFNILPNNIHFINIEFILPEVHSNLEFATLQSSIRNSVFLQNGRAPQEGGAIRYYSVWPCSMLLQNNIFVGMAATIGGSIYIYVENFYQSTFNVEECIFMNSYSSVAGTIASYSKVLNDYDPTVPQLRIKESMFVGCTSEKFASALSVKGIVARLKSNVFALNKAEYGGAIGFLSKKTDYEQDGTANYFFLNQARARGGAIYNPARLKIPTGWKTLKNKTLNTDSVGESIFDKGPNSILFKFYKPIVPIQFFPKAPLESIIKDKQLVKWDRTYTDKNITDSPIKLIPGHPLPYIIQVKILDQEGELFKLVNGEKLEVSDLIHPQNLILFKAYNISLINGSIIIFDQIKVRFTENTPNDTISFMSSNLSTERGFLWATDNQLDLKFNVEMKNCDQGDIFDNTTQACTTCPRLTFYNGNPKDPNAVCKKCSTYLECLGGNLSLPRKGYYKYNAESDFALECQNTQACLGGRQGIDYSLNGFCEHPFQGNLCNSCEQGYAKVFGKSSCVECSFDLYFYFRMLLSLGLILGLIFYKAYRNIKKGKKFKELLKSENPKDQEKAMTIYDTSAILKVIFSFKQLYSFITVLNLDLISQLKTFVGFTNSLVPLVINGFTIKCFIKKYFTETQTVFYLSYLMTLFQPLAILILVALLFFLKNICSRNKIQIKERLSETMLILLYLFQPEILSETLQLLKCKKLGEDSYFLDSNLDVQCYTTQFYLRSVGLGVPMLILWGVVLPLITFLQIRKGINSTNKEDKIQMLSYYSFLVGGLKEEYYYWEFVNTMKKISILIVVIGFTSLEILGQVIIIQFLFFVVLKYTRELKTYHNNKINALEILQSELLMMIVFTSWYTQNIGNSAQNDLEYGLVLTLSSITGVLLFIFMVQAVLLIIKSLREIAKERLTQFKKSIMMKFNKSTKSQEKAQELTTKANDAGESETREEKGEQL